MDPTILFPLGLLSVGGIVALLVSINKSQSDARWQKSSAEYHQNRLFEAGKELESVSALLTNKQFKEACDQFVLTSNKIDTFRLTYFPTLEWKSYFEQVKSSREQTKNFLIAHYPQSYSQSQNQFSKQENINKTKTSRAVLFQNLLAVVFIIIPVTALIIYFLISIGNRAR